MRSRYSNIPDHQEQTQRIVDQFNRDEAFWRSREPHRRSRRRRRRGLGAKAQYAIELLEFASLRPPEDCIGIPVRKRV